MEVEHDEQMWQLKRDVLECNLYMLEKQVECDTTFTFMEPEENISAHKYMLISRSPVFFAMLAGPARDKSGKIHIEDINKNCFMEMLRFKWYHIYFLIKKNI